MGARRAVRYYPAALALCILFFSCSPYQMRRHAGSSDGVASVRVLILAKSGDVTIASSSLMVVRNSEKTNGKEDRNARSITIRPGSLRAPMTVIPGKSPVAVNGTAYRGSMVVRPANGSVQVINVVRMDDYLKSVVPGEIPANWEMEALKAQAVASRTFAYHRIIAARKKTTTYDLDATVLSQVYRGISEEKPSTSRAVEATSGEVILHGGGPILSYFHSTCGGKTVNDRYVWKASDKPYLEGVRCGFCGGSTRYSWESKLSLDDIRSRLASKYGAIGAIRSISFSRKDDRVTEVTVRHGGGALVLNGNDFRLLFPDDTIQSLYFTSKKTDGGLLLQGKGWGHGVGMCQWGARGMARNGYGYKRILNHYYSGVRVGTIGRDHGASILSSAEHHH